MRIGFDLIILGAPTAGKDTQAAIIKKKFAVKTVESGKFWRQQVLRNDKVGALLRKTFAKGKPTPVNLMKKFLKDQLKNADGKKDMLFIGNPRLKPEAQLLTGLLKSKRRDYFAIYINLPEKEIYKRTLRRQRDQQDKNYLRNRINYHRTQVSKTVEYYRSQGKMRMVNGNQPVSKVAKDILKIINDYQRSQANSKA